MNYNNNWINQNRLMCIKNGYKCWALIEFHGKNNVGLWLIMFKSKKLKLRKERSKQFNELKSELFRTNLQFKYKWQ